MSLKFVEFMNSAAFSPHPAAQRAEAARYALIRRLSPFLRHHLVRYLQPIGMIYGVMDHRLSSPEPNLRTLHQDASNINKFAKAALAQCTDISSWLAPEEDTVVLVGQGVQECVNLLAGNLNFRGFQLINEVQDAPLPLRRDALRSVLAAALLALTDERNVPATVTLSSTVRDDYVTVSIQLENLEGDEGESFEDGYRKLHWSDVEAIATVEDVLLTRRTTGVSMSFAIEPPHPAPLSQPTPAH